MTINLDNPDKHLLSFLQNAKKNNASGRCVYVKASLMDHGQVLDVEEIDSIVKKTLNINEYKIFICSDNDIFIFTKLLTVDNFNSIKIHLQHQWQLKNIDEICNLYEINKSINILYDICAKKIDKEQARKDEVARITQQMKKANILNQEIDGSVVDKFKKDRDTRQKVEVMIVEDDPFSRQLVCTSLAKEYQIIQAKDGKEAIASYAAHGPNILFLDIELPDISGYEVISKILSFDPDAYIVMLSGKGDKENVLKAVQLGAKGFVGMPFAKDKLLQYINKSITA